MTSLEFVLVLAWVLLPPLSIAMAALVVLQRGGARRTRGRTVGTCLLLASVSASFAFAFVAYGPDSWGRYIGVRDTPFMWAPFAVIAVTLAFPLAMWLARSGARA